MKNAENIDFSPLLTKHLDILNALCKNNKNGAKLVGGCVRDFIKNSIFSEDVDISTVLTPEETIKALKSSFSKITILDKDKEYGTIIAILNGQRYEITTTRADLLCLGRQAKVEFCKDYKTDSQRRDFTINALYLGIDGELFDFYNGLEDLKNGKIVFIGNAEERIKEDYLRILRFFRFSTKFENFDFGKHTIETIKSNLNGLSKLSKERIRLEIYKLLSYDAWFEGLKSLNDAGIFEYILQNFKSNNIATNGIKFDKNTAFHEILKIFYFFNYDIKILSTLEKNLVYTHEEKNFCSFLMNFFEIYNKTKKVNIDLKLLIFNDKNGYTTSILEILDAQTKQEIINFLSIKKDVPFSSKDLIEAGFSGKKLGEVIKTLTKKWIGCNFDAKEFKNYYNSALQSQ